MAIRILIIEDHVPNLELIAYLLTAFGHTVLEATDGRSGLEMAEREAPDLIICDIQLPDINGYEIASRLKQDVRMRDIPLVAITALAMIGERERALQAGFNGYISKPITPETFVAEVESFLSGEQRARKKNLATAVPDKEVQPTQPMPELVAWRATILVVDNTQSNLELARSIFEPSGYRVLLAGDVEEAMTLARQTRPDLVLSDVNMPEASGLELALRIKSDSTLADVPVILISATMPRDTRDDVVLATGASKFLRRPIDPLLLLREIENTLEMSRPAHA
jgi:two-component system cell cycle response regulator